jgi:uracil-DNA glycosylase
MKQSGLLKKQKLLEVLNYKIRNCEKCSLSLTRKHSLPGEGNINPLIMFVALSPGVKEDSENKMFIGPSGLVFNKLLDTSGIDRDKVFMTNLIKCILPKNRRPKMKEIELCSQFLFNEILIIQPEIIVPLGSYATRTILKRYKADPFAPGMEFTTINGHLLFLDNQKIFPLSHPAALLYNPSFEQGTKERYKKLKSLIKGANQPLGMEN